jgi:hypothetical protein
MNSVVHGAQEPDAVNTCHKEDALERRTVLKGLTAASVTVLTQGPLSIFESSKLQTRSGTLMAWRGSVSLCPEAQRRSQALKRGNQRSHQTRPRSLKVVRDGCGITNSTDALAHDEKAVRGNSGATDFSGA